MRLVVAGLALLAAMPAAAGVPGFAAAGDSGAVATQPLAAGEVLLEMAAIGTVSRRADQITLIASVESHGATAAEADAANLADVRRVTAVARAAGAGDVVTLPPLPVPALEMETAPTLGTELDASPNETPQAAASRRVQIRLTDPDRVERLLIALRRLDLGSIGNPTYALVDTRAARTEARRQAIATARADAEAAAAALGMRIVRIVRVTERMGMDLFSMAMSDPAMMRRSFEPNRDSVPDVSVTVAVGIDFALAPQ